MLNLKLDVCRLVLFAGTCAVKEILKQNKFAQPRPEGDKFDLFLSFSFNFGAILPSGMQISKSLFTFSMSSGLGLSSIVLANIGRL